MLPMNSSAVWVPSPVFSAKTCTSAINSCSPITMMLLRGVISQSNIDDDEVSYPVIFRRLDLVTSSPQLIICLPMTSITYGLRRSIMVEGPAMAKMSFPAVAMGLAPKTGEATKEAPRSESCALMSLEVSGWTVDVSTNIFPSRLSKVKASSIKDFRT